MKITHISRLVHSVVSVHVIAVCAVLLCGLAALPALAQTNASHTSSVGTWNVDMTQSTFGSDLAPKSITLTILEDTPQLLSWRVEIVDDQGKPFSYSWSGPKDGTMHPIKGPDGRQIGEESAKEDHDALIRRGGDATEGSSFEGHATMSADGNTLTDIITTKAKDGKTTTATTVMHRVPAAGEK
jgi:hypothetical protein